MANDELSQIPRNDIVIKRLRSDLLPPPVPPQSASNEPGALRLTLLGALGCFAALSSALIAGVVAPLLIPCVLVLLVVALVTPESVRRVSNQWPFSLIPGSYTAEPRRLAAIVALVVIPISGIAGLGVYRSVFFDSDGGASVPPPVAALAVAPSASPTVIVATPTQAPLTPTPTPATPTPTPTTPIPTPRAATPPPTSNQAVPVTPAPPVAHPKPAELTADQQAYLADLYAKSRIIDNSNDSFNQLIGQLQSDSSLISNPDWQKQMTSQLVIWQGMYEAAKNGSAPSGLEIINGKWIEYLGHKNLAADELTRGIKQLDLGLINRGEDELDTAADVSWKLEGLLDSFLAQFDETPGVYSS